MPAEAYQYLSDEETSALVAYIRRLPRAGTASPPRGIGPIGRFAVATGGFPTSPALVAEYRKQPAADLGAEHAFGRHLARTTCSGCHGSDLGGRKVSPEIDAPDLAIAGAYDLPAFTRLLREGVAPGGKPVPRMRLVAREDSRFTMIRRSPRCTAIWSLARNDRNRRRRPGIGVQWTATRSPSSSVASGRTALI